MVIQYLITELFKIKVFEIVNIIFLPPVPLFVAVRVNLRQEEKARKGEQEEEK